MAWIIQTKHEDDSKRSMYFTRINRETGEAIFVPYVMQAAKIEKAEDARKFIKDHDLKDCHILPA